MVNVKICKKLKDYIKTNANLNAESTYEMFELNIKKIYKYSHD